MTNVGGHPAMSTGQSAPGCDDHSDLAPQTSGALYHILAESLADPAIMAGAPLASALAEVVVEGAEILGSAACRRALFILGELPPVSGKDLRRRFQQVANRPDARPIPLYESLALNGHLISPTTERVAEQYRRHGLEPDGDLPDSASMELAFLGFLAEGEAEAELAGDERMARRLRREMRQFLNEHVLTWLPQVGRTLAHSGDPYFVMLGHLLEDYLREEQLRVLISNSGRAYSDVPLVADPHQCGLCGFCVQTCPTGALRVSENDAATYLLLKPERCIGCAKCLPVCPDNALRMIARPENLTPTVILRQSPRAHCPRCAAPTVSQAEMAGVFARLEADENLQYRLSLCGSCKAMV